MLRDRSNHVQRPEATALTVGERRQFRQLQRGLRAGDPSWFAVHCPRRHRRARIVRHAATVLSFALVFFGAMAGFMPLVLGGVVLAVSVVTSHVSSRVRGRPAVPD